MQVTLKIASYLVSLKFWKFSIFLEGRLIINIKDTIWKIYLLPNDRIVQNLFLKKKKTYQWAWVELGFLKFQGQKHNIVTINIILINALF